jgi:amidohydrolase
MLIRPFLLSLLVAAPLAAQSNAGAALQRELDRHTAAVNAKVVTWRRDFHQNPELSGFEERTARVVAEHLRALGLEVRTGVGGHGVVGVLRGGRPGRVVALRADMDALPVTEQVDLPFRSRVRSTFNGLDVGVMHACGHDNHVAILMGAAEVLTQMKAQIPGTVVFIFQPAEEGHPEGGGGAERMLAEGAFENPTPEAIFGLHVWPGPAGSVTYKAGPAMAAANGFRLTVHGRQTHGSAPWGGVDPVAASAQVVNALQTVVSRQTDITSVPAIVTVATIHGGVRNNIIPDSVVMEGTIRTFGAAERDSVFRRIERTATAAAQAMGARAVVRIDSGYPVTHNDEALTTRDGRGGFLLLPAASAGRVRLPRRHAARPERGDGAEESLAVVLRRRIRVADRCAPAERVGARLAQRAAAADVAFGATSSRPHSEQKRASDSGRGPSAGQMRPDVATEAISASAGSLETATALNAESAGD